MREAINGLLRSFGHATATFSSAEALLEYGQLDLVACLIADVRLGGMSGLQLQRELISMGRSIPIIIVTAFSENGYRAQAMKAGAVEFLSKPISAERLLAAVETALNGKRPDPA